MEKLSINRNEALPQMKSNDVQEIVLSGDKKIRIPREFLQERVAEIAKNNPNIFQNNFDEFVWLAMSTISDEIKASFEGLDQKDTKLRVVEESIRPYVHEFAESLKIPLNSK